MGYRFKFKGGVIKPSEYNTEKFLLFFIVGGKEIPLYKMRENGLVWQEEKRDPNKFGTSHRAVKLFVLQQGFGIVKRFYSFYMELQDRGQIVEIVPFSGQKTGFVFSGMARFLKKSEALALLPEDAMSRKFLKRQAMLPVDTLRSMITIDRGEMRKGVRHIRVGRKS